jgi:serine/threonine protein kinase
MARVLSEHPSKAQLAAFGLGRMDATNAAELERHILSCADCCAILRGVNDDTLVGILRSADTPHGLSSASRGTGTDLAGTATETPVQVAPPGIPPELVDHPRYRVVSQLGVGGMGVVYRAEHRLMERVVALKVIGRELLRNPDAVKRFQQEVKAAAKLSHPNIVAAHDADQAGDLHFLVMEHVDGTSLARIVEKRGPLPVLHACHYIRQAALGLQHAHEHGMVHRDIKPQNLMLTRKGQVKILDFGLARLAREQDDAQRLATPKQRSIANLTSVGTVLGTPDYIAPEQVNDARRADIRSDIYSLGCTLYYLLSGRVPFPEGNSLEKLMHHSMDQPPPLAELRPELSRELLAVVERMMAKDPLTRYQTPVEVAQALLNLSRTNPSAAQQPQPDLAVATLLVDADTPTGEHQRDDAEPRPRSRSQRRLRLRRNHPLAGYARPVIGLAIVLSLLGIGLIVAGKLGLPALWNRDPDKQAESVEDKSNEKNDTKGNGARPSPGSPGTASKKRGSETPSLPAPLMRSGPRVLLVLASRGFYYPDYEPVRKALDAAQVPVTVAALTRAPAIPMPPHGTQPDWPPINPDIALSEANAGDYDMIIFCGGLGVLKEYCKGAPGHETAKNLILAMLNGGKFVTALCGGPAVLADAGVLRGKRATCYMGTSAYRDRLVAGGAIKGEGAVVEEGKIITGRGPDQDAQEFARVIVARLKNSVP